MRYFMLQALFASLMVLVFVTPAEATRIRDLTNVRGVRQNQLVGYGLVVGLAGTGDRGQARFTVQSTAAMLRRLGVQIDTSQIQTKNAAAVIVTATLPAFANPGTPIDVTVSSVGNARSLTGGTLVQTPLYGSDRNVYAVAQGPLVIGGYSVTGRTGSSITQNHTTVARIPEGALVERRVHAAELGSQGLVLGLRSPSFTLAQRIVAAVDEQFGAGTAHAEDPATVRITLPAARRGDLVGFMATVQALEVEPDDPARVVIDERTGTVAVGSNVRIRQVAVARGGLTVEIAETTTTQQAADVYGQPITTTTEQSAIQTTEQVGALTTLPTTASLDDVVTALNLLGASPRDLIAIFQALRGAGALDAELVVQ